MKTYQEMSKEELTQELTALKAEYEKIKDKQNEKQILFLKQDIKKLNVNRNKYLKIIELHKKKLIKMGAIKNIAPTVKTYKRMVYNKRSA